MSKVYMSDIKRMQLLFPLCKRLRLTPLYQHLDELIESPDNLKMSHIDLLYLLLSAEVDRREANALSVGLKSQDLHSWMLLCQTWTFLQSVSSMRRR